MKKEDLYKLDAVEIYKLVLEGKHLKRFPSHFWDKPNSLQWAKEITKWFIEDYLKLSDDELKKKLCFKLFKKNRLNGMISELFNASPYKTIENAYPDKFKPWEFNFTPMNFWNLETAKEATKWLIEEKLELTDEQIKEQLSAKLFRDNGLTGLLTTFGSSPFKLIDIAYPGRFKPWEFNLYNDFWNLDTAREATRWLIEEKLKLTDEQIKEQLSVKLFRDNGLDAMLYTMFNYSSSKAIENLYPGKFKPWELMAVPNNFWNLNTAREATKWLLEEKLKLTDKQIKEQVSFKLFKDNGLCGMAIALFKGSTYKIIENAYPGKFKKSDLKGYKAV